jgi:hypothetical protein
MDKEALKASIADMWKAAGRAMLEPSFASAFPPTYPKGLAMVVVRAIMAPSFFQACLDDPGEAFRAETGQAPPAGRKLIFVPAEKGERLVFLSPYLAGGPPAQDTPQESEAIYSAMIQRATTDWAFRQQCLEHPESAYQEHCHQALPPGVRLRFIDGVAGEDRVALYRPDPEGGILELSDADLDQVAGGAWYDDMGDFFTETIPNGAHDTFVTKGNFTDEASRNGINEYVKHS